MTEALKAARRIVVKVGSSLVTNEGRGIDAEAVGTWCRQLAALAAEGREVVMVSSGAIAEGMKRLGWKTRPTELHEQQAAAAVGQMGLAHVYETQLSKHGVGSAQVLLTHADLADRERYLNARSTLLTLLGLHVIPVINENDTVVNDEIKVGDNDTLGALVANLVMIPLTIERSLSFRDWMQRVRATISDATANGIVPLEHLRDALAASAIAAPELAVTFSLRHEPPVMRFGQLELQRPTDTLRTMPWGLSIVCIEGGPTTRIVARFDAGLYDPAGVAAMLDRLVTFVVRAVDAPDDTLADLLGRPAPTSRGGLIDALSRLIGRRTGAAR